MKHLEVIQNQYLPENLEEVMEVVIETIPKLSFLDKTTKIDVKFDAQAIRASVFKSNKMDTIMSRIVVNLYPYLNDLKLYFARRRVGEHFSLFIEDVADYHRFHIIVPYYLLDFKALSEEEKIYCIEQISKHYKFNLTLDEHDLGNVMWIKEHDFEFYHKYRLLLA